MRKFKFIFILFIVALCTSCTIKYETKPTVSGNFFKVIEEEIIYNSEDHTRKYTLAHKEIVGYNKQSVNYVHLSIYTKEDLFNVGDTLKLVNF